MSAALVHNARNNSSWHHIVKPANLESKQHLKMISDNAVRTPPTVEISFKFNGEEKDHKVIIGNAPLIDINKIAPDAVNSNTSFGYAGRHDHGPLPQLRFDAITGNLISSLQEAKQACDEFLTQSMKDEIDNNSTMSTSNQVEKKARLDSL